MEKNSTTAEGHANRLLAVNDQLQKVLSPTDVGRTWPEPPADADWTAPQILAHLVEMIPYWLDHCRRIIAAQGEPPPFGRLLDAPERLEGVERGAALTPGELLPQAEAEIRAAAAAIRAMSPAERGKIGLHIRRGEMSVADVIEVFIVAHAEDHLAQLREALRP